MTSKSIDPRLVRRAPQSTEHLLELLFEGLDWPRPRGMEIEDIPLLDWSPDELHLDPESVARLTKIQQLPALTTGQPFGVFILSFDGGRLPVGAVRRVVNKLVRKQRARRTARALWKMSDLIFFCQSNNGVGTLHVVAFRDTDNVPIMKVITWDTAATDNRIELIATQNLPALCWPDEAALDADRWRDQWTDAFTTGYRDGIRTSAALAEKMADVAREVRDEVVALYSVETTKGPLRQLFDEVKVSLRADLSPDSFADMYAQTMVYGLLTSRITHPEAFSSDALNSILKFENPFLDALYASFRRRGDQAFDVDDFGLHDLAEILGRADMDQVLADFGAADRKDDPVVFFYEEFLDRYDPAQRRSLGAYYTPIPVVRFMIRAIDQVLKFQFGLPLGVADQTTWGEFSRSQEVPIPAGVAESDTVIQMIDPATGTGTFILEWLRRAEINLREAGEYSTNVMKTVVKQIDAFEISLSSYAVAHLKTSLELEPALRTTTNFGIRLTDTLAGRASTQHMLFDEDPIAREGQLAEEVKFSKRHSVVLGNPPYARVDGKSAGGWISRPEEGGRSLFDDIHEPAKERTNFAHQASLYNLYVYFWRWAIWKSAEWPGHSPSVVGFITASSFLEGPGFIGLRKLLLSKFDSLYVVDLGGDNLGARTEENVFPIQTPVTILLAVRNVTPVDTDAKVHYVRVFGNRSEKLALLDGLKFEDIQWVSVPEQQTLRSFRPVSGDDQWTQMPALIDLFPWQQPGCKFGRLWPQSPSVSTLKARWAHFTGIKSAEDRAKAFVTGSSGRNIYTQVRDMKRLVELKSSDSHQEVKRYGYRSFDRQWAFYDPRLAKTESPSLWASLSDKQLFLVTCPTAKLGLGPAATVSVYVPDLHYFNGRGGKDVIPLFRDRLGTPNIDVSLLTTLTRILASPQSRIKSVVAEELFAYCYGVLAGSDYTQRFKSELETPGPRIPLTRDPVLFLEMVHHGGELLWLQTFGERFGSSGRCDFLIDPAIKWAATPSRAPSDLKDVTYNPVEKILYVGDGRLCGVEEQVWAFEVSGMPVVKKWLGYRTLRGAGKTTSSNSPLDRIRPNTWESEWSDELREVVHVLTETQRVLPKGTDILNRILAGELIRASELPMPAELLRKPPNSEDLAGMFEDDD